MTPQNFISVVALTIGLYWVFRTRHYERMTKEADAEREERHRIEVNHMRGYAIRHHVQVDQVRGTLCRIRELATNGLNGVSTEERNYLLALISTCEACATIPAPIV
ncbi:hypothetical protein NRB36_004313 [Salmonella enterica]|nr:hypothetical protein [Salmonella enterica]EJO1639672.1 hypothetical protein [Salmonella enterica]